MAVSIRPAMPDDMPAIGVMFEEFSQYLHAIADPEIVTENASERIAQLAFGPKPLCAILIAENGDEPVGYLIYSITAYMDELAPALHVLDFFVRATQRRRGTGKALMHEARRIAEARGATRMLWRVWRRNPDAVLFYEALGAEVEQEDILMYWKIGTDAP